MLTAKDVAALSTDGLEALLAQGEPLAPEELAGHTDFGVSLGLPKLVERLTWKVFAKAFYRTGTKVVGCNVRLEQHGVDGPLVPRRDARGEPETFGPFAVRRASRGVLLDYGAGTPPWSPLGRLRDPLVAVNEGSTELLVGTTRLAVPWGEARTPSYFTLERRAPWPLR
jgi:hypothetical protein